MAPRLTDGTQNVKLSPSERPPPSSGSHRPRSRHPGPCAELSQFAGTATGDLLAMLKLLAIAFVHTSTVSLPVTRPLWKVSRQQPGLGGLKLDGKTHLFGSLGDHD